MATGVVLYHRSQGQQAKAAACLSLGPSTTADIIGQQRARLGAVQGCTPIAGPDSRPPRKGDQSGRGDAGYADSASSALQTSPSPPVGIQFGGTTSSPTLHVEMYKLFFGSQEMCPDLTEDAGLSCNRPDTQVSSPVSGHIVHLFIMGLPFNQLSLGQKWIAQAKLIRCPAPLPETTPDPVLTKMLEVAPSEEVEGGTRKLPPPRRRLSGKEGSRIPPSKGRRGPPLKTRRP